MAGRNAIAAAFACGAALASAGSAQAHVPSAELRDAQVIASQAMHSPCAGTVSIRLWRLRSDTLGIAKWDGMWNIPSDQRHGCEVVLNSRDDWTWPILCTTIVHEYGHLAGRRHSHDPKSVMHEGYRQPYPNCMHAQAARRWGR